MKFSLCLFVLPMAAASLFPVACGPTDKPPEASTGTTAALSPEADVIVEEPVEPGVRLRVWDIGEPMWDTHEVALDQSPNVERIISEIDLEQEDFELDRHFRVQASCTLPIEEAGEYTFRLTARPGGVVILDNEELIRLGGSEPQWDRNRTQTVELAAGNHYLAVEYYTGETDGMVRLEWRPPGQEEFTTFGEAARIDPSYTPIVSDGAKRLVIDNDYTRPGDRRPLESLHPAWRVVPIRPEGFKAQVSGLDVLPDGKTLVVTTLEPPDSKASDDGRIGGPMPTPDSSVYLVHGALEADDDGDLNDIEVELIAEGLFGVAGVYAAEDGTIYITQRDGLSKLVDRDGDGTYESREPFLQNAWITDNYHHFTFGLVEKDGFLYTALSTAIAFKEFNASFGVEGEVVGLNGPNPPHRGSIVRVNLQTGEHEFIAGGLRTPNGLGLGPDGELFVSDNQGAWLPANKLIHIRPGHFYGHYNARNPYETMPEGGAPSSFEDQPPTPPTLWLPHEEISNSPTQPLLIHEGPFAGHLLLGELRQGGIRRAFLEKIGDTYQGAVFRHTQGLEGGVNRLCWGPDGALYAGMIGRGPRGNWNWRHTTYGLQKLVPTGETTFEMHRIEAQPDGFVIHFTEPVSTDWLANPANYKVDQFTYEPTPKYGGPKVDEEVLAVASAVPSDDGKSVRLTLPALKEGRVVHFHLDPVSTSGTPIWSTEAWYTYNTRPQ